MPLLPMKSMPYHFVCFCCLLLSNGLVAKTYSSTWQSQWADGIYGVSSQYDKYEAEETEESCCPMKKLDNTIYQMVGFNLTSAKQHDCKDGCIYHDPQVVAKKIMLQEKTTPRVARHASHRVSRTLSATRRSSAQMRRKRNAAEHVGWMERQNWQLTRITSHGAPDLRCPSLWRARVSWRRTNSFFERRWPTLRASPASGEDC